MSIVHQTPTPAYPGRRWRARRYPGSRSVCPRFRAELRSDLATLAGVPSSLVEDVELCAGEAFANAVTHSRSQRPGGVVVRMLSTPTVVEDHTTLRLSILDDGPFDPRSLCVPTRCSVQGWEQDESGRGLLLIHQLAGEWGTQRWTDPGSSGVSGTMLWAEFAYPTPAPAPTIANASSCVCGGGR